jgi:cardiolipin synthase
VRTLAEQAFSRAAGAPLVPGNSIRLLKARRKTNPAWLDAIAGAKRFIHFESYIIHDDAVGDHFSDALIARARDGVPVRVIYDWMGGFGKTSRRFWRRLRAGGVKVRLLQRADPGESAGLAQPRSSKDAGCRWDGGLRQRPLCRTGLGRPTPAETSHRGAIPASRCAAPAVRQIDAAFAQMWMMMGPSIPVDGPGRGRAGRAGRRDFAANRRDRSEHRRALAPRPARRRALARERVWLTDAYYGRHASLRGRAAARGARRRGRAAARAKRTRTFPLLRPLSKAGYRTLLERACASSSGTARCSTRRRPWRTAVGTRRLDQSQPASWLGNCELDVLVEDDRFGRQMEEMYAEGPGERHRDHPRRALRVRRRDDEPDPRPRAGAAAPGARQQACFESVTRSGAAVINRRTLEPVETRIMLVVSIVLLILAALVAVFPRLIAYPSRPWRSGSPAP